MKYVIIKNFEINDLFKNNRIEILHFLLLPFGLSKAYLDVAVTDDSPLEFNKVAWLIRSTLNEKEVILISLLKRSEK